MEKLLTPREVAAFLRVSADTLRALVSSGELRFINVGTSKVRVRRMFDPADLALFVERRRQSETPIMNRTAARRAATTATSEVIGFRARQALSPSGKLAR